MSTSTQSRYDAAGALVAVDLYNSGPDYPWTTRGEDFSGYPEIPKSTVYDVTITGPPLGQAGEVLLTFSYVGSKFTATGEATTATSGTAGILYGSPTAVLEDGQSVTAEQSYNFAFFGLHDTATLTITVPATWRSLSWVDQTLSTVYTWHLGVAAPTSAGGCCGDQARTGGVVYTGGAPGAITGFQSAMDSQIVRYEGARSLG